jgi:hypothetical protein
VPVDVIQPQSGDLPGAGYPSTWSRSRISSNWLRAASQKRRLAATSGSLAFPFGDRELNGVAAAQRLPLGQLGRQPD